MASATAEPQQLRDRAEGPPQHDRQSLPATRGSLVARLRDHGDGTAWEEFVGLYGPAVHGYLRRRGVQPADAEDVCQEVFRGVASAIGRFAYDPAAGRFRAWLFTAAERARQKWLAARAARPAGELPASAAEIPADTAGDWELAVRRRRYELALERVACEVSPNTLAAFRLTAEQGLPGEVAAERLGMTRAAVYLARSRVLARLRAAVRLTDGDAEEAT